MSGRDERPDRALVLGIAGGIGAGKSAVARALKALGAVVVDSDARAKAQLDVADVREELVRWWGPGVLDSGGNVDRGAVARIVFGDAEQRERLEALVHPRLKADRVLDIERAGAGGLVVIDAPLLFEAGVDAECDAVVFVETPRAERIERVRARGWDESELARREGAQWPLEKKRALCGYAIDNAGRRADLGERVRVLLERIRADFGR